MAHSPSLPFQNNLNEWFIPFEKYTDLAILSNHVKPEFFEPSSEKTTKNIFRKSINAHATSFQEIIQLQKLVILEQFEIL